MAVAAAAINAGADSISLVPFMLKPGEERPIASRLKAMFKARKA